MSPANLKWRRFASSIFQVSFSANQILCTRSPLKVMKLLLAFSVNLSSIFLSTTHKSILMNVFWYDPLFEHYIELMGEIEQSSALIYQKHMWLGIGRKERVDKWNYPIGIIGFGINFATLRSNYLIPFHFWLQILHNRITQKDPWQVTKNFVSL